MEKKSNNSFLRRVWDTQGVPCVYPKAMLAKKYYFNIQIL
jgi:hypothetical protein